MNWEDIRLFLALARNGSARGAAVQEGMSHSTVARRVEQLEKDLGVLLFDRDVRGYRLTDSGKTMLSSVLKAEDAFLGAQRKLQGKDKELRGVVRLTTPEDIATHLIMPDLAEFAKLYPDIELSVAISPDHFDLSRLEADVALRILRMGTMPPDYLVGRKLTTIKSGYYASPEYLAQHDPWSADSTARWIGWNDVERYPAWVKASPFPNLPVYGKFNELKLQVEAARCGMGLTALPCFYADVTTGLVRIPGCEPYDSFDLWILSHPDLKHTARLRTFRAFAINVIKRKRKVLEGDIS